MVSIYVVLNNVTSPQRLIDTARVVFAIDLPYVKGFITSKASGMAAQTGIPEVAKMAFKLGKTFIILPTLKDVIDLIAPTKIFICTKTEDSIDMNELELSKEDRILLVISGVENGFTKAELALGTHVFVKMFNELPPPALVAVALYILFHKLEK